MMRRMVNNVFSVLFCLVKFSFVKLFHWNSFYFYPIERFSPNVVTEFNRGSMVIFGKKVRVHSGTKIKVRSRGMLSIEDNVKINYNCIIVCRDKIEIGEGTEFGPSVYLYDHDHNYRDGLEEDTFLSLPISIGKNCWIGANSVILRGTKIEDNCVVGAGTVLAGYYKEGSVIVQKRNTTVYDIDKGR